MAVVTGALGSLIPKLFQLLGDEYKLQKGIKARVKYLADELMSMQVALCKVAMVPRDQLDPQVMLWASQVREASYDMEDILDTFLVRVHGGHQPADADKGKVERLLEKMSDVLSLSKAKARRVIAGAVDDMKKQVDEIAKRRDRYKVDNLVSTSATATSIDPRVLTLHTKVTDLVDIDEPRDQLIKMLTLGDDDTSDKTMKIVSVVGFAGLGKTTLAKLVYENLTMDTNIHCKAFVPVGQNPKLKKVYRDILLGLDKDYYSNKTNFNIWDEGQLIEEIKDFLKEKRYVIVIDDVWEVSWWNAIRIALEDNNLGCKVIITTRCSDVAELVHCSYPMKPLSPDSSKVLFYGRIFGSQDKCPQRYFELSDKILKKCGGVPLAIITLASLLANKSDDITDWQEVCNLIGSGLSSRHDMYINMRKILSLSYYDLPPHMKTCFMYLSIYPEDYEIRKDRLIWRWISEGFIQPQDTSDDLFVLGESYFNDLVNRSLVQPIRSIGGLEIYACRVHDMILDLICSLSKEENFVTTSDDIEEVMLSKSKKLRRLSLRNSTWPGMGVSQVRSISIFQPSMDSVPSLSCFKMLRVLDLEGCSLEDCQHSKLCVGNLIHLRYLGLEETYVKVVPRGIEKLQFLEVLKMSKYPRIELPLSIFGVSRRLMCLEGVHCRARPDNLLKNLASLQVLKILCLDKETAGVVEELGHLTKLTVLQIIIYTEMDQSTCDALINSLGKLPRLQTLRITHESRSVWNYINWERLVPPSHLQVLLIKDYFSLFSLPKWISPASLPHLTYLNIIVIDTVRPEDIQNLGTLPNLSYLRLEADRGTFLECPLQKFVVSSDAFPRVNTYFFDNILIVPSMFPRGAMPMAKRFWFCIRATDFFDGGLSFGDLAMEHLLSIQTVGFIVHWDITSVSEEQLMELKEALNQAADRGPWPCTISEQAVVPGDRSFA